MANTMLTQRIVCSPLPIFLTFMEDDMKHLTRIAAALLAGAMAFTFASCDDDDDDDDGVWEVSEWDYNYTESSSGSGYWVDWEIDFYSNGTFEIDLDVETSSDADILDVVFARGTYTGDASSSGTVTMTVTGVITGYDDVLDGTFSGVNTTWQSDSTGSVTLTATIEAKSTLVLKSTSSSLSGAAGSGTDISSGWSFSYNW